MSGHIAALDMTDLEWSNIFPRSRVNLPLVMPFVFLGDTGETKLIREATLKGHISRSRRGRPISRIRFEPPWFLNLIWEASNAFVVYTCPVEQGIMAKRVESGLQLLGHATEYFIATFECTA